jgi:hypothetical protein
MQMQTSSKSPVSLHDGNGKFNPFDGWLTFAGLFSDVDACCESEESPLVIGDTEDFWNHPYHRQGIDYAEPEIQ